MKTREQLLWDRVIEIVENKYSKAVVDYYVTDAKLLKVDGQTAVIAIDANKQIFWQERDMQNIINLASMEIYGQPMNLRLEETVPTFHDTSYFDDEANSFETKVVEYSESTTLPPIQSDIKPNFTFSNFIQGKGNRWAFIGAQAVTEKIGIGYNPLFIYGGPGLGKTHLLNAIGNEVLKNNPNARVKYITTENFVNDFIDHIRHDKMGEFKTKYRNLDVLLIDDIQSLGNKEGTIEEFFNTFNELHGKDKQIVLTSDREPDDLNDLPERLVSRFQWGLQVQITPPDYETRIAILKNKIEENNFKVDFKPEVIEYLANQFHSNVRELEGALKSIQIVADYHQATEITIPLVIEAIQGDRPKTVQTSSIEIEEIQTTVSKFYNVTIKDIKGTKRPQNIVRARQVAMYLSRELTDNSLPKIGKAFGGRDHSTVLHACNKIKNTITQDEALKIEIDAIKDKLQ